MSYDVRLADRIRRALADEPTATERQMFGGVCFMLKGHMCVGIVGDDLMVRVGPAQYERALDEAHVRPMDFTGRPMRGYVYVEPEGYRDRGLDRWVGLAKAFVSTLPKKARRPSAAASKRRKS